MVTRRYPPGESIISKNILTIFAISAVTNVRALLRGRAYGGDIFRGHQMRDQKISPVRGLTVDF